MIKYKLYQAQAGKCVQLTSYEKFNIVDFRDDLFINDNNRLIGSFSGSTLRLLKSTQEKMVIFFSR